MALKVDTRRILAQSLEELLTTSELEKITVKDIVDHCGASRSVFYRYFRDKYELATWVYESAIADIMDEFQRSGSQGGDVTDTTLPTLRFIMTKKSFFQRMIRYKGQNSFQESFIAHFTKIVGAYYEEISGKREMTAEVAFAIRYMAAAHSYAIEHWIENGFREPPEWVAAQLTENSRPMHELFRA